MKTLLSATLLSLFFFSGCSDFLDLNEEDNVSTELNTTKEEVLIEKEQKIVISIDNLCAKEVFDTYNTVDNCVVCHDSTSETALKFQEGNNSFNQIALDAYLDLEAGKQTLLLQKIIEGTGVAHSGGKFDYNVHNFFSKYIQAREAGNVCQEQSVDLNLSDEGESTVIENNTTIPEETNTSAPETNTTVPEETNTTVPEETNTTTSETNTTVPEETNTTAPETNTTVPEESRDGYVRGTYFVEWSVYGRDYHVNDIPADKLTHILYGFIAMCGDNSSASQNVQDILATKCIGKNDSELMIVDDYASLEKTYPEHPSSSALKGNFGQLIELKKAHPHLKVLPSIGGWTLSDPFFTLASSSAKRKIFVDSAVAFLQKYDFFDGLDIDWEFPGGGGANSALGTSADRANYTALMADLRAGLDALGETTGRHYELTTAIGIGPQIDKLDYNAAQESLDYIFMMTYDYYGTWNSTIGHQSGLYATLNEPTEDYNIDASINAMFAQGVRAEKIVLGVSKYGRGWSGVSFDGTYFTGSGAMSGTWEAGILDYKDIATNYFDPATLQGKNGFTYYFDEVAQAAYLYNESAKEFISFDDVRTVYAKGAYAKEHRLAGLFSWEIDADNGDLSSAMYDVLENNSTYTAPTETNTSAPETNTTVASGALLEEYRYWVVGGPSTVLLPASGNDALVDVDGKKVAILKAVVASGSYAEMSLPINPYESSDPFFTPKVDLSASSTVSITYSSNTDAILQLRQTNVHGGDHNQAALPSTNNEEVSITLSLDSDFLWLGTQATTLDKSNVGKFNFAFLKQNESDGFAQITVKSFVIDNYSPLP